MYRTEHFLTPRYLEPMISAYGKYKGDKWKAEVSIDQFVEGGYWLARHA